MFLSNGFTYLLNRLSTASNSNLAIVNFDLWNRFTVIQVIYKLLYSLRKMSLRQPAWDKICEFTTKPTYLLHDEYMVSKTVTDEMPNVHNSGDDVKRDLQTRHCIALGKLTETEARLKAARKFITKRRVTLDKQWEHLALKEAELRNNFITFSNSSSKIAEMTAVIKAKVKENAELREDLKILQETKARMDATIKKHYLYEGKLIEEKNFVIMGLNNQIANLQARYENANIKSLESEQLVIQIKNNAIQRMSEIDQVKTSIWNLCTHMAQGKRQPMKIKKDNLEEQVMYIKRTLTELAKVNQLLKKQARIAKLKKKVGTDK
ncbi:unnamed protein product [Callosobruchus maculatus]|uniref:DUF4201 domain-containing protein n=1 Tax=Callosobruchus maculatus TaxID=64391 RepID=A0A653DT89_CALMS|nr:unnamed protein product [Callosobruchus maculatus]